MEVVLTHVDQHKKEMLISVPWIDISGEYEGHLKRYSRMPIKGFRPGHTPAGAIEALFREQIKSDMLYTSAQRICRAALTQHELEAGSNIEIYDCELQRDNDMKFRACFVVMPSFDLPDYAALDLPQAEPEERIDLIAEKLLSLTDMELHSSIVEREMGFGEDQSREAAADRAKLMLILRRIATKDGIEVSDKDVRDRIRLVAAENGVTEQQLKDYLTNEGGMGRFTETMLAEAVLGYIDSIQQ